MDLPDKVALMALEAASALDGAGLPSMALEALHVSQRILEAEATAGGMNAALEGGWPRDKALLRELSERLLTSCWAASLPLSTLETAGLDGPERDAREARVLEGLGVLCNAGLLCDPKAVTAALRRHARATTVSNRQPLLLPPKLRQRLETCIGSPRAAGGPGSSRLSTPSLSPTGGRASGALPYLGSPTSPIGSPLGSGGGSGMHHLPRTGTPPGHNPSSSPVSPRASMELRSPRMSGGSVAGAMPLAPGSGRPTGGGGGPSRSSSGVSAASVTAASAATHHTTGCLFEDPLEVRV